MFVATAVLSGVLSLAYALGGIGKLLGTRQQVKTAEHLGIPWPRYRLIGVAEISASVGLLIGLAVVPIGVAAAAGLVLLMAGALAFRVRVGDGPGFLLGDAMFLLLAAATAALRLASG
jgi:uncharacterized membrane protein YphA (DoxX/SURF4 family)